MPFVRNLLLALAFLTSTGYAYGQSSLQHDVITIGTINNDVRKHTERFVGLALYLEHALADQGVRRVNIAILPSVGSMTSALADGAVDLYFDSPLVAAQSARLSGGHPFLRRWRDGVSTYHSIFIVPTDSPLQTLSDLEGATVGFQDAGSTSGFMLPSSMVLNAGMTLRELSDYMQEPADDEVGYVFTDHDRNTLLWLARGWIDAGATDPEGLAVLEAAQPGAFRVLARSVDVPRQVVVHGPHVSPEMLSAITTSLVDLVNVEGGPEVLDTFGSTDRFDEFPDGVEATFEPIHRILDDLNATGIM